MTRAFVIRVAAWSLAATLVGACAPTSPLANGPEPVRTALDPFMKAGFECAAPSTDQSGTAQWNCTRTSSEGVAYSIILDADDSGLKNVLAIVDQSQVGNTTPELVTEFFTQVADMDLGASNVEVIDWIGSHAASGGQEKVGPVLVTLDGLQPVDHLNLFAQG